MKIKKMTLLLAAMLPWCAWATTNTMTISTPSDLTSLATLVNSGTTFEGWTITLEPSNGGNELDMTDVSFTPIGNKDNQFLGTFDGNGKTISNLAYSSTSSSYVGLFGNVGAGGIVKDLTLEATIETCSFTGKGNIGGIAGKNEGLISNCINNLPISSTSSSCGGIVGSNTGTISGCTNNANVSGNNYVGGIVGNLTGGGNISYCTNTGNVDAKEGHAGGIFGNGLNSEAKHCFTSGNVSTKGKKDNGYYYTGAIAGCKGNYMNIKDCYYDSKVAVTLNVTNYNYLSSKGCGIGDFDLVKDVVEGNTVYCSISLTPTQVSGTYWTTYYNGVCSMKVVDNTTTKVYAATRNGETLTLKEVTDGIINKGQGVILKSTAESITMTSTSDMSAGNAFTGNVLSGVDEETAQTSGNTYYVLSKGSAAETANEVGFYKYSSTSTLAAHKAFMAVQGEQGIRSFVFEDDAAGIRQVEAKEQQGTPRVYDLQGRSVPTMKKGIYVVNSKKIWNR